MSKSERPKHYLGVKTYFAVWCVLALVDNLNSTDKLLLFDLTNPLFITSDIARSMVFIGCIWLAYSPEVLFSQMSNIGAKLKNIIRMILVVLGIIEFNSLIHKVGEISDIFISINDSSEVRIIEPDLFVVESYTLKIEYEGKKFSVDCQQRCNFPAAKQSPKKIRIYSNNDIGIYKITKQR